MGTLMKLFVFSVGVFSLVSSLEDKLQNSCDHGWTDASAVGMGCLFFFTEEAYTWEEADVFCYKNKSAHQVIIRDSFQLEVGQQQLDLIFQVTGKSKAWTAGSDSGSEGSWYYAGDCDAVPSLVWHSSQPNDETDGNYMALHEANDWKGVDRPGSDPQDITVCQK